MNPRVSDPTVVESERVTVRGVFGLAPDHPVVLDDQGWDSRVYLVDDGARVCKVARDDLAAAQYRAEIAALRLLDRSSVDTVALPRVSWVDPASRAFAYDGIVGEPLQVASDSLDEARRRSIGTALGLFLARIHTLRLDGVPSHSVADDLATYSHKLTLAAPALAEHLTDDERLRVARFVNDDLTTGLLREPVPLVLAHGDLGPWNLIVTAMGVGIIDFGDVGYHDPAKDFSGFGDPVITAAAFASYGADAALRARAALRANALPILDIPFFLGKGDRAGVLACVAAIRAGLFAPRRGGDGERGLFPLGRDS